MHGPSHDRHAAKILASSLITRQHTTAQHLSTLCGNENCQFHEGLRAQNQALMRQMHPAVPAPAIDRHWSCAWWAARL